MPRAIVYPHKAAALAARPAAGGDDADVYARGVPEPRDYAPLREERGTSAAAPTADDWAARLVKHVPAEVLPPFLLVTSLGDVPQVARGIFVAVFAVAAVWVNRRNNARLEPAALRPRGWIHDAFALTAFLAWAIGTSEPTRELVGCSVGLGTAIMVTVAFAIGQVDAYLAERFDPPDRG